MKSQAYLDHLLSEGKISFTRDQIQQDLGLNANAVGCLLQRLKQKATIASPTKGYYLIIQPEFRALGCLPPDFFIDDLMRHLQVDYYVALLSAALYHGAAHQQPQIFQVMIPIAHRDIQCGKVRLQFIKNQSLQDNPTIQLKTRSGLMRVATPESTAKDLLNFIQQSGGIGQIATIIDELVEVIHTDKLQELAQKSKNPQWIQRLGYLLETLEHKDLAASLFQVIKQQKLRTIPMVPSRSMTGAPRNKKWHIAKNAAIESDLKNDTY